MNEITVSFFSNCSINKRRILSLENLFLRAEYAFFSCAKIITETRLKGAGIKRTTTLVTAAEHSIGNTEAPKSARKEIRNLLNDYEVYKNRMDELMEEIEETLSEIPYIDKLMEINGIGIKTLETLDVLIIRNSCRSWPVTPLLQKVPGNIREKAGLQRKKAIEICVV